MSELFRFDQNVVAVGPCLACVSWQDSFTNYQEIDSSTYYEMLVERHRSYLSTAASSNYYTYKTKTTPLHVDASSALSYLHFSKNHSDITHDLLLPAITSKSHPRTSYPPHSQSHVHPPYETVKSNIYHVLETAS